MPALQQSAYRTKNPSSSSGCTIVDNLTFDERCFLLWPFVARIMRGSGAGGLRSERSSRSEGVFMWGVVGDVAREVEVEERLWDTVKCEFGVGSGFVGKCGIFTSFLRQVNGCGIGAMLGCEEI